MLRNQIISKIAELRGIPSPAEFAQNDKAKIVGFTFPNGRQIGVTLESNNGSYFVDFDPGPSDLWTTYIRYERPVGIPSDANQFEKLGKNGPLEKTQGVHSGLSVHAPKVFLAKTFWLVSSNDVKALSILVETAAGTKRLATDPVEKALTLAPTSDARFYLTLARQNQFRFRQEALKIHGNACGACEISESELLQAAHIIPYANSHNDDLANSLVLCANHHLAFDRGILEIDPTSLRLSQPTKTDIGITKDILKIPEQLREQISKYLIERKRLKK